MKVFLRLALLLSLGGCRLADNGAGCLLEGASYVGFVGLSRVSYPEAFGPGQPSLSFGGTAMYFQTNDAGYLQQQFVGCGSDTGLGQCCYIPPPDAGAASSGSPVELSHWNVTVTDQSNPDSGVTFENEVLADGGQPFPTGETDPLGSLIYTPWTGGDVLLVQGDGAGTVGTFGGAITTAMDFKGLDPGLFSDAGAVPLGKDLTVVWTSGGASSIAIGLFDETTSGEVLCAVADNGSFEIPSSVLSNFAPGDQGGIAVARSALSCVYSDDAAISIIAQTQTVAGVRFQ